MTASLMLDRTGIEQSARQVNGALTSHLPTHDEVMAALERIISSPEFIASPHLAAFLQFSVEKSLAGEGATIKAYSIATSVLGRAPTFDPQADPIVRVEATRLRRALERYYLHEGAQDPIFIDIPRGRYIAYFSYRIGQEGLSPPDQQRSDHIEEAMIPEHERHADLPKPSSTRNPVLKFWRDLSRVERRSIGVFAYALIGAVITWSVVPLLHQPMKPVTEQALVLQPMISSDLDGAAITTGSISQGAASSDRIIFATLQLTRLTVRPERDDTSNIGHRIIELIASRAHEFEGIPLIDSEMSPVLEPHADQFYTLVGSINQTDSQSKEFEINIRLIYQQTHEIVWTKNFILASETQSLDPSIRGISSDIVQALAGLNGAIRIDGARRHRNAGLNSSISQNCLAQSDVALRAKHHELTLKSIACISALIERNPDEALLYKQLASLNLVLSSLNANDPGPLAKSIENLTMALALEPNNETTKTMLKIAKTQQNSSSSQPLSGNHYE